ncbi:FtsW/RodA/SpoVE family cell cycle protein [Aquihabitans daechungensis]|uniref:FtsW/RodA/SpoVE family cell cycle protein n=1 Tax=Aquihabitans daechungensis TaxID=1052257 RepID=UPI003BA2DE06
MTVVADVGSDVGSAARSASFAARRALPAALVNAWTAALGAIALADFHRTDAPSPTWAAVVAGVLTWVAVSAGGRVGGRVAARATAAMCLLTTVGWVVQSRAPISQVADGGSTVASTAALNGTPVMAAVAVLGFLLALAFGHRVVHWSYWGGPVGAAIVLALLLAPFVPGVGVPVNGVRSWAHVGPVRFQPGDLGRVALILFLAAHLESRTTTLALPGRSRLARAFGIGAVRDLVRVFGLVAVAIGLLVLQDDLGPAIILVAIAASLAWVASGRLVYPAAAVATFVGGCVVIIGVGGGMAAKVSGRLEAWFDPFGDGPVAAVNGVALEAQARGGLLGIGLGRSFDPYWVAARNDYILPQVGLRLGLAGVALVAVLLAVIVRDLLLLSRQASDRGRYLALGAACALGFQALLIAAGSTSAFALTGVVFPFVSYGGTSLVASASLVGLTVAATSRPPLVLPRERTRAPRRPRSGPCCCCSPARSVPSRWSPPRSTPRPSTTVAITRGTANRCRWTAVGSSRRTG